MRISYSMVAAMVLFALPAYAQSLPELPDGPITRAQVRAMERPLFDEMDQNHDGIIDAAEFARYRERMANAPSQNPFARVGGHWFEHADTAHDGRVTFAEVDALVGKMFDKADLNHNGVISDSERKFVMKMMKHKG